MTEEPDYRTEKMETREGRGLAQERRRRWEDTIPPDVWRSAAGGSDPDSLDRLVGEEKAEEIRGRWSTEVRERSELMGFWISWHLAGGFQALEIGGWNRATLFRKVKQFRTTFGAHPDEFEFEYIQLDLSKAWIEDLLGGL